MLSEEFQDNTPKTLNAGPFKYDIVFDPDEMYESDYNGVTAYRSRKIKLNPQVSETQLVVTLMHEALHAIGEAADIDYWENHKYEDRGGSRVSIDKIDLMARTLVQFLRENKDFVIWVTYSG